MTSKELKKMLDATRREVSRKYGFRQSSYINFKVENGYFFCLYFNIDNARLEVKPMWADDLWWDIWESSDNKNESLSLRGTGAYALSGQVVAEFEVLGVTRDFSDSDVAKVYERVFKKASTAIIDFLQANPDADKFLPDERMLFHDPDRLLHLMALIHNGKTDDALSVIKEARKSNHKCEFRSGMFEDSYTYIRRWCKHKKLKYSLLYNYMGLMFVVSVISIFLNPALWFFGFKEYFNSHSMIWFAVWIIGFMTCARLGYAKAQHNYWVKVTFIVWGILWVLLFIPFAIYISLFEHDGFTSLAILSSVFWQIVFTLIPLGMAIWYYKKQFK